MKIETYESYSIKIGQYAAENSSMLIESNGIGIWFHAYDKPSCHIILDTTHKFREIPHKVMKRCAYLCKINSPKIKSQSKCPIMYSYVDNIEPTEIAGQVKASNYKLIHL
jgi:predicted ribosome quality control (RQC) complex YloA/Tae2 family protein